MSFNELLEDCLQWLYMAPIWIINFFNKLDWTYHNTIWWIPEKTAESDLIVEVWELSISEGVRSAVRGDFQKLNEFYFPELDYSFNIHNGQINNLLDSKNRYTYKQLRFSRQAQPKMLKVSTLTGENASLIREIYSHIKLIKSSKYETDMEKISDNLLSLTK